jgi:hypothetical protein
MGANGLLVQLVPGLAKSKTRLQLEVRWKSLPDHNADCHDEAARCLDHHHGNAEGADELQAIGVRNLRGVLQSRENSGRDAKESSPEAKLFSSRA